MAIDPIIRSALEEAGTWGDFVNLRGQLQSRGIPSKEANEAALKEVGYREGDYKPKTVLEVLTAMKKEPEKRAAHFEGMTDEQYDEFMGREAGIVEQYVWVAKRLEIPKERLDIMAAPCAEAWSILMDARRSASSKASFLERSYAKLIPPKTELGGRKTGEQDGVHIVDAIDRLLLIREKANQQASEKEPRRLDGKSPLQAHTQGA